MTTIKNRSPYICLVFSFRDNLTILSINGLLLSNFKNFFFAVKHVFWSKITILHMFDSLEDHTTKKAKKKKIVTGDVTNFSPMHCESYNHYSSGRTFFLKTQEVVDNLLKIEYFHLKTLLCIHYLCTNIPAKF